MEDKTVQDTLTEEVPDLRCPECGRADFASEEGLNVHRAKIHNHQISPTAECSNCGDVFELSKKRKERSGPNYCSKSCMGSHRQDKVVLECEVCGDEFETASSTQEHRRYCSRECTAVGNKNRRELECEHCGESFTVQAHLENERKYCSKSCAGYANAQAPTKTPATFKLERFNGYPGWTYPKTVAAHQLIVIANGADPNKVFGRNEWSVDHKNGCKIDNRPSNLELLDHTEHGTKDKKRQTKMGYSHKEMLSVVSFMMNPAEYLDD